MSARAKELDVYSALPTLSTSLFCFMVVFAFSAFSALLFFLDKRLDDYAIGVQADEIGFRGAALSFVLSEALAREWAGHTGVASNIDVNQRDKTREMAETMVRTQKSIARVAVADLEGIIIASSKSSEEDTNVSTEAWFQRGFDRKFYGGVYEHRPLARFIESEDEYLLRYIDFSGPITRPDGTQEGVLVYRIRVAWLRDFLEQAAVKLSSDVFLLNSQNKVILASSKLTGIPLSIEEFQTDSSDTVRIDGTLAAGPAIVSIHRIVGDERMPYLDWRLVASTPLNNFSLRDLDLNSDFYLAIGMLLIALAAGTIVFTRQFLRPLQVLSLQAEGIAAGKNLYPLEVKTSREAARFSAAFSRIQSNCRISESRILSYRL